MEINIINSYINECKEFWQVTNFEEEIINWKFNASFPKNNIFNLGHPIGSHKGPSIGDILPYTRLPKLIKDSFPNSKITVPNHFECVFRYNPYVDDFDGSTSRWGSLGTWGTTIQRTCNVFGFNTFKFDPIMYYPTNINSNTIIFSINSKTGGTFKNHKLLEDIIYDLKSKYYCIQIGSETDYLLKNINEYILNLNNDALISIISKCGIYIGVQNSLYHLSKAIGLNVIGILPETIDPRLVILPFLTQINDKELEMLSEKDKERSKRWIQFLYQNTNIVPYDSHHIGWLYPDVIHLTENFIGTNRCPSLTIENILLALDNKIYPFNNPIFWDFEKYKHYWI
jgi:hypothetical protein